MAIIECRNEDNWIYGEFKNLAINCGRTIRRFIQSMATLSKKPSESISAASKDKAEAKAIYRMLDNKKLTEEVVLKAHRKQTIKNITESKETVILSIQDTSEIDYTNLRATRGLGEYGGCKNLKGLIVHSAIAVTPSGIIKGLLDQKIWARDPSERGKREERHKKPIEEKESYKWIESMENSNEDIPTDIKVVNVCDREGDIFELFHAAIEKNRHFLVRATHNRKTVEESKLFDKVIAEKVAGDVIVEIPRDTRKNVKKRNVTLEVKYTKVELPVPAKVKKKISKENTVELTVIVVREKDVSDTEEPIEWYLVTNIEISNVEDAFEKVRWYVQRWKIERFHYVLKSGCKIEELQEETAERLKKLILMYSIIAIRILWITYIAREHPNESCEEIFQEEEWKVLYCIANKTNNIPKKAPSIKEAVSYVAKLGGFLGRKGDGDPGAKVIWRGLKELNTVLEYYKYLTPK